MIKTIFYRIRLFRHQKKESYFALYKILGFMPGNISVYEEALLHKSSSRETGSGRYLNNERLEFLGDAVLDAVVADLVFQRFKQKNEGFLTNTRSKIVKRETLNHVATQLGLDKLLVSASRINTQKTHILGNALEAFIGAVYIDKGYEATRKFIDRRIIRPYINVDFIAKKEVNFKSKLLEWTQKHRVDLEYNLVESFTDGENNPVFQTQVNLNGLLAGFGTGFSKKESQQEASHAALNKIKSDSFVEQIKAQRVREEENAVQEDIVPGGATPEEGEDILG